VVGAAHDDQVAKATAEKELASVDEAEVAGVEPSVSQGARRGLGLAEVALHHEGCARPHAAHLAIADGAVVRAAHLHLGAGHGGPDRGDGALPRAHAARGGERVGVHRERALLARGRREGEREGGLREPVHGHHRLAAEPVGREALGEARAPVDRHRLGAVEGVAPGRQVDAREVVVADTLHAHPVGEARGGRDGAAVAGERAQPERGAREEALGAEQHEVPGKGHRGEQAADEPHVVVERQPRDADGARARGGGDERAQRRALRHELSVRERDGLRVDGGPRRELDHPERVGGDLDLGLGARPAQRRDGVAPQGRAGALDGPPEQELHAAVGEHGGRRRRP
jgi:hypothetical protein